MQTGWNYGSLLSLHSHLLSIGLLLLKELYHQPSNLGYGGMKLFVAYLLPHCLAMVLMKQRSQLWLTDGPHGSKVFAAKCAVTAVGQLCCQYLLNPYYAQISVLCDSGTAKQNEVNRNSRVFFVLTIKRGRQMHSQIATLQSKLC